MNEPPPNPTPTPLAESAVERLILEGDLTLLSPAQRVDYYRYVCQRIGVDPSTRPFEYLKLNNKVVLYARRECTEQLRMLKTISVEITSRTREDDTYTVSAKASLPGGRCDESIGVVAIKGLSGDNLANALMKCETKAKRRVTLSICGLGMMDETEIETVKGAERVSMPEDRAARIATGQPEPLPPTQDEAALPATEPIPDFEPAVADTGRSLPPYFSRGQVLQDLRTLHDSTVTPIRKMARALIVMKMKKHNAATVSALSDEQLQELYSNIDERISEMEGRTHVS